MATNAYAQGALSGSQLPGGSLLVNLIPIAAMFAIFYFILIRPQMKKQKEHQQMLDNLKEGDNVITSGGIIGTIFKVKDDVLTVQIAENVKVKVARPNISALKDKK